MADNYYSEPAGESANNPGDDSMGDSEESQNDSEDSALVPKSILHNGIKVGDVCKFKVVHLYDEEAEIEYIKNDKDKDKSDEEDMENPVDKMAKANGMEGE